MITVFIGGSRRLSRLNDQIRHRLDQIMANGHTIVVGDANGADKAVQTYLASHRYADVFVYCTRGHCRNNVGRWQSRAIEAPCSKRDFRFFAAKDVAMANDATHGFMVWDGKSKGTFNNLNNLLRQQKPSVVYFTPNKRFYTLKRSSDLTMLLAACDPQELARIRRELKELSTAEADQSEFDVSER